MLKKGWIFILAAAFISGCGGSDNTKLEINYNKESNPIIPAGAMSCTMRYGGTDAASRTNDITERYFEVRNFVFTWSDPKADLYIVKIKITVQLPSGAKSWTITGQEMASLMGAVPWDGVVKRATSDKVPTKMPTVCNMIVGGITISDEQDKPFEAAGTVRVTGYSMGDDGVKTAVNREDYIQVANDP